MALLPKVKSMHKVVYCSAEVKLKSYYKYFAWIYPIGRALYPAGFCTLEEVGRAMINAAGKGYPRRILEVKDIVELAKA